MKAHSIHRRIESVPAKRRKSLKNERNKRGRSDEKM